MKTLLTAIFILGAFIQVKAQDPANGQKIFSTICTACHTIGQGKRVGPDLKGVTERRNEAWLLEFIKSSQSMVKKGDPTAVALFNEYKKVMMPDNNYTPAQIKDVLAYIKKTGGSLK